ncbi:DUF4431 domain-containing protein [Blastochloris viridis]|uniref:DUF4431 domain-containing protein n=1 Tax=Blastochloris viridis TaxID=1079 RepID=A0A0H5BBY5_BLAVI|nr:DUF4431 domain-containing protein [Blastochloris viridis]ALK10358.1 hypothetical protein BVIR_2593 [Blastochloris viridis]BAR99705.1 hypothetical protein BV133_2112 [Blastochloris viridis]CUU43020.1 hypothetical protein BVIRIDIS_20370 [Blastochloris viridis]
MTRALLIAVALTLAAGPAMAACLDANAEDAVAEGRLSRGTFQDAAGRTETAFILSLAAPTCLTGPDEFDQVPEAKRLHLYASDEAVALARFVGKTVRVSGRPFGAHTAHHHAPIVMDVVRIEAR